MSTTLLFLNASGLDASKHDDRGALADLLRMEAMWRGGATVEAFWFAMARAHSLARHIARVPAIPRTDRERDLAILRCYLRAARTISGGAVVSRVQPGDHLRPVEPAPTHGGATLFTFAEEVPNNFRPATFHANGVFADVVRYQSTSGVMLQFHVIFPDRQRWQWGRTARYSTVEEAVREGNRLTTIGLAALKVSRPPVPAPTIPQQLSLHSAAEA